MYFKVKPTLRIALNALPLKARTLSWWGGGSGSNGIVIYKIPINVLSNAFLRSKVEWGQNLQIYRQLIRLDTISHVVLVSIFLGIVKYISGNFFILF